MKPTLIDKVFDLNYYEKKKRARRHYFIPSQKDLEILKSENPFKLSDCEKFDMHRSNFARTLNRLKNYGYIEKRGIQWFITSRGKILARLIFERA